MKKTSKYLDIATKLLTKVYEDNVLIVADIVCAHADRDYEAIYKHLKSMKEEIEEIEYKLKQEGNIQ